MLSRGFLFLIGLTSLVVGYVVFDFQYEKYSETKKSDEALLLKLNKDQINECVIERFGPAGISDTIILKKDDKGWALEKPTLDLVDQNAAADFVEAATLERAIQTIKSGDGIDWKIYGLDQPKGKITFKTSSGQVASYEISATKNYMADVYLRKTGENKVYLASSTWSTKVDKTPYDFRDKRVFRESPSLIKEVYLKNEKEKMRLVKKSINNEAQWVIEGKPWKLDQVKTSEVGLMLNTMSVTEFVTEDKPQAENFQKLFNPKKKIELSLQLNEGKTWSADFYQNDKKEYFVQTSDPQRLVKISAADGDKFAQKTSDSFRNRHEPFDFNKEEANTVQIMTEDGKNPTFESEKAKTIITSLRNLEVKSFELKEKPKKWTDLLQILNDKQNIIFKMSKADSGKMVAIKTNLFEEPFLIEESQLKSLGVEKLLHPEKMDSSPESTQK